MVGANPLRTYRRLALAVATCLLLLAAAQPCAAARLHPPAATAAGSVLGAQWYAAVLGNLTGVFPRPTTRALAQSTTTGTYTSYDATWFKTAYPTSRDGVDITLGEKAFNCYKRGDADPANSWVSDRGPGSTYWGSATRENSRRYDAKQKLCNPAGEHATDITLHHIIDQANLCDLINAWVNASHHALKHANTAPMDNLLKCFNSFYSAVQSSGYYIPDSGEQWWGDRADAKGPLTKLLTAFIWNAGNLVPGHTPKLRLRLLKTSKAHLIFKDPGKDLDKGITDRAKELGLWDTDFFKEVDKAWAELQAVIGFKNADTIAAAARPVNCERFFASWSYLVTRPFEKQTNWPAAPNGANPTTYPRTNGEVSLNEFWKTTCTGGWRRAGLSLMLSSSNAHAGQKTTPQNV